MSSLTRYRQKRDFERTAEPQGAAAAGTGDLFVIQKHAARRLHYDFRLELDGTLKSWSVPKGPSFDPSVRRLAVHVEDHPLDYAEFEGVIPAGNYGAGEVIVWDRGVWTPRGDPTAAYRAGRLKFQLSGHKLRGGWTLVRTGGRAGSGKENWLLIKERDAEARPEADYDVVAEEPRSVVSDRSIEMLRPVPAKAGRKTARRVRVDPGKLEGAREAALPAKLPPLLPTRVDKPPAQGAWLHEIKLDGYRTACRIEDGRVRLFTRAGHDWTDPYAALVAPFAGLRCGSAMIDGEIVVQDAAGMTRFSDLQQALAEGASERLRFFAFDLLHLDGFDLTDVRLDERKRILVDLLSATGDQLVFSEHLAGPGASVFDQACRMGLEGIVSKKAGSAYRSGRSTLWVKTKCRQDGEFRVVGFAESEAVGGLSALLIADDSSGDLVYAGRVGAGFTARTAADVRRRLATVARQGPPVVLPAQASTSGVTWVEPVFDAAVDFNARTSDGALRGAVFRELVAHASPAAAEVKQGAARAGGPPTRYVTDRALAAIDVTNPMRPMFGADGPTKLDLVLYYARVGDWMLRELLDRPVSLVRCPSGAVDDCFYQRHAMAGMPAAVRRDHVGKRGGPKKAAEEGEEEEVLWLDGAEALLGLAQFGVIEFHPWGCRIDRPDQPDRIVLDLDPDPGVGWPAVVDAAFLLRERLAALDLPVFVKTTGGKGLHLVVPLKRRHGWQTVGGFARAFAESMAREMPARFTANLSKRSRKGRIFIDHLRNIRGATAVAAYSLRARPAATAATPVGWDELAGLDDPGRFTYATVPDRLAAGTDPWGELAEASAVLSVKARRAVG